MDLHHIEWRVDDRSVNLDSRSEHDRCFVSDDRTFVDYAGNQNYDEAHSTGRSHFMLQLLALDSLRATNGISSVMLQLLLLVV